MNKKVICNKAGNHAGCTGCFHCDEHDTLKDDGYLLCAAWADCHNWDTGELIKQRCVHVGRNLKCFDK